MAGHIHIIGAGVAGLSCAVSLTERGESVTLYEAAGHAGGRCRSYEDAALGRRIDNGNHLLLSGNSSAMAYLKIIGASDSLTGPETASYPFVDLKSGERWTVRPNKGVLPWWVFCENRRVPGTNAWDYLKALRLALAGKNDTLAKCLGNSGPLFERFWEPLGVAVLNTDANEAAAALLWPVMKEAFGKGEDFCRPRIAREGLSESFVDPALAYLKGHDADVNLNTRVRTITLDNERTTSLDLGDKTVSLDEDDVLVLAVPPAVASSLLPDLTVPLETRAIVNGHFILDAPRSDELSFMGLVGSVSQWLFVRGEVASVTVSAADKLAEQPAEEIAETLWKEVAKALELGDKPLPAHRIVKEKRATFAQTPEDVSRRPGPVTAWSNLFLAGDWTNTGLPATLEGAIRSGRIAANRITQ
ncbi:MAG: NAD(P)-binding protein [Rhodospirillaceae bacterium]|nr:NAD(P)-binding protein [Rhodospirillaceae bacterium]MBT7771571.1 NAD(P)-binding protein [Rhodospirillales bacterium]MBT4699650.1 NAD(P)-binding protein [Rhodospirillaceae bacterium]MBT5034261.1 NAD(P)-binding protein [Rhodospirillaceae bacterium]MBT6218166.1 NAD(P)-binding protein [Rhodospirillaceae bacterium]